MAPRKRANSIGGTLNGGGPSLERHGSAPLSDEGVPVAFPAGLLGEDGKLKCGLCVKHGVYERPEHAAEKARQLAC